VRYGSRKFLLALLVIASADVLLVLGSLTASVWAAAVGSALGLYMAGNVGRAALPKQ
jgi:hypothetical protein